MQLASHQEVQEVAVYSIMENPMTACGCFECIVMLIPEANGVMVVSREDTSMTPAGMTFSTLAGIAGGGLQTPGVMGVGKFYLVSPKFISSDGGFKRVVWMSKNLKDSMEFELRASAEREGIPDFLDMIADGTNVTTVEELEAWVKEKNHPVLDMEPMEAKERERDSEEKTIAKAEAIVEKAMTEPKEKPEKSEPKAETPAPVEAAPVKAEPAAPAAPTASASSGDLEERVERLERSGQNVCALLAEAVEVKAIEPVEVRAAKRAPRRSQARPRSAGIVYRDRDLGVAGHEQDIVEGQGFLGNSQHGDISGWRA